MEEIQENKKWNERAVTNEALDRKLDALIEFVQPVKHIPQMRRDIQKLQGDMDGVKLILQDHTDRLRRLESRMDKLEVRMDNLDDRMSALEERI